MKWTSMKPKTEGWYWYRTQTRAQMVGYIHPEDNIALFPWGNRNRRLRTLVGEFLGPIDEPRPAPPADSHITNTKEEHSNGDIDKGRHGNIALASGRCAANAAAVAATEC